MNLDYLKLHYNEASFKGAHNSYQRDETLIEQITWHEDAPSDAGCRAVELDISQSDNGLEWSVGHKSSYDTNYRQLSQFLSELQVWSRNNPDHDVITLYLDLKHVATSTFPSQLDQYICDYLGDYLGDQSARSAFYTPGQLMGDCTSVPEGARTNGWPTLGELRNQFIVCLTGNAQDKATYAATSPKERLCFADQDESEGSAPSSADCVFFNYHLFSNDADTWGPVFKAASTRQDAIIRGYVLDGESLWNKALAAGCHVLATDKIKGHQWAKVGNEPFVKLKPLNG